MSGDVDVRVGQPFTVGALRDRIPLVLQRIAPGLRPEPLRVAPWTPEYRDRRADTPSVPDDALRLLHGGDAPVVPTYLVMTEDATAIAGVTDLDAGDPDDPDGGRWLSITREFYRDPASHLLGLAAAVAAAELTGSPVVDESADLTGARLAPPEAVVERLHHPTAAGALGEAAATILTSAGLA